MKLQTPLLISILLLSALAELPAQIIDGMSGMQIMEEVQRRNHPEASVYEEQSIILADSMGNRDTRTLRRYSKTDNNGNVKYLLIFDSPADVYGTALLATRDANAEFEVSIYLPANGGNILQSRYTGHEENILGTDFSFDELFGEVVSDYQFVRREQKKIENVLYNLVDVYEKSADITAATPIKRHYVREDNFYITRTDYLDRYGRLLKQQTQHDLKKIDDESWRAGMILMENFRENHSTLIKINRRIFSVEHVPDEVFSINWLYQNQPPLELEQPTNEEALVGGLTGPVKMLTPDQSVVDGFPGRL